MKTQTTAKPEATTPMTARAKLRELDKMGEFAPSWRPNPGDEVTGEVLRYSSTELPLSGACQIATIGQENGEPLSVFILGAVLQGEFEKQDPKVGETITVRYVGKHPEKGYKKFVLFVHREEEQITSFRQAVGLPPQTAGVGAAPATYDPDDVFADENAGADSPYVKETMR